MYAEDSTSAVVAVVARVLQSGVHLYFSVNRLVMTCVRRSSRAAFFIRSSRSIAADSNFSTLKSASIASESRNLFPKAWYSFRNSVPSTLHRSHSKGNSTLSLESGTSELYPGDRTAPDSKPGVVLVHEVVTVRLFVEDPFQFGLSENYPVPITAKT